MATLAIIGLTLPAPPSSPAAQGRERLRLTRLSLSTASPSAIVGSSRVGRTGAERSAVIMVSRLGGLPVDPDPAAAGARLLDPAATGSSATTCPRLRLRVSWSPPEQGYRIGAYVAPLGPPPTAKTTAVNGVVLCAGSRYAYLGFEEEWDGSHWLI